MRVLYQHAPAAIPLERLSQRVREESQSDPSRSVAEFDEEWDQEEATSHLTNPPIGLYLGELVHFYRHPAPVVIDIPEHPRASDLARFTAKEGSLVPNQWHEPNRLDESARALFQRLDGTKSADELARDPGLAALFRGGDTADSPQSGVSSNSDHNELDMPHGIAKVLERFRESALLVPGQAPYGIGGPPSSFSTTNGTNRR